MAIENTTSGIVTFHVWVQGLTKQTVNLTSEQFAMHVCKRDNSSNRGKALESKLKRDSNEILTFLYTSIFRAS